MIQNKIIDSKDNIFEFNGSQGEQIDRLGVVKVRVEIEDDKPLLIQIKGDAIVIFRTEIEI